MVSISGIKYQKELELLPYLNKSQARILIGKESRNLDKKIDQLKKMGYLKTIKNSLYVSDIYYGKVDKKLYLEYVANILRFPSYISLEYILSVEGLIPEAVYAITSITIKSSRTYQNFMGNFIYQNIRNELFMGYRQDNWEGKSILKASKAKALFDFLYLKKMINLKMEITIDLRINWDNFSSADLSEFSQYVTVSKSKKMIRILNIIRKYVSK
ncbi:hypothetical protein HZB69_04890 [Candidatus Amesbacteria bacterium]|nr:hypothetical protein [Candidatus Amesbacteria bacterium]